MSWYPEKQAFAVDAFTISWTNFSFYAFPPFAQIPKVLKKIIQDKAQEILLVPNWPTQPWTEHRLHDRLSLISGIVSGRHLS